MITHNQHVEKVGEIVNWYMGIYPINKQELLELAKTCILLEDQDEIRIALDDLEENCQRICNPSEYLPESEDPIDWSSFI